MEPPIISDILTALPVSHTEAHLHPLVELLSQISIVSSTFIGYIGVAIMLYGTVIAFIHFVHGCIFGGLRVSRVRIELGKHLALGLEFLVGKDIIESIVYPTWDDLGKLGAIIVLRTVVTIFLSRELKDVEEEIKVEKGEVELERLKQAK
ncbi:DUF1622 domain-containing protein [Candidatus Peregrinibacteria bacterium]|nr:DUF1622 domain-containing protein [Candidatus Peregrinibacteria bacterium]